MRVAVVSDIHGNLTAFEAVLADLKETAPDLILHGGDLTDNGSGPVEIIDWIRDLGWPGVIGNTDEMLVMPRTLEEFASGLPHLEAIWTAAREMAAATREKLGEDRLAWLGGLPRELFKPPMALVHASPRDRWRAPMPEADDAEMESVYASPGQPVVVYGHVHRPFVRTVGGVTIANSGSVGQPHDGDPRACYLLVDGTTPQICRVEYDLDSELQRLSSSGLPHWEWVARTLKTASPQMP